VCVGDSVELAVSLFSLSGFVTNIKWEPLVIQETPREAITEYNKDWAMKIFKDTSIKNYCDLNRICEVEDIIVEWYEERYYQK
jgi:hypothetical protein